MDEHLSKTFNGVRFVLFGFDAINKDKVRWKLMEGGGVDVSRYGPDCTHLIVDKVAYDDPICVAARNDKKAVVTNLWVDHSYDVAMPVDTTSVIYKPPRDLNGIPGAKSFVVCLTGYQRHERDDIMIMVGLMGATFSKPLVANKVTHLVCYKFEGEKYELAKRMKKIKLVNHFWLEDCLKAWEILPEEDYNKSGYELEMMEAEAEAKDSEEETEDITTKQYGDRKVTSPQNSRLEIKEPHQSFEQEILRSNIKSSGSKLLSEPDNVNEFLSVTRKEKTPDPTSSLQRMHTRSPGFLGSAVNNTLMESSRTPDKVKNLASTSKTVDKSPRLMSSSRTNAKKAQSPTALNKGEVNISDEGREKSPSIVGLNEGREKSPFTVGLNESNSRGVKTPLNKSLSHLEEGHSSKLSSKRKMSGQSPNAKSPKERTNLEKILGEESMVNKIEGLIASSNILTPSRDMDDNATLDPALTNLKQSMEQSGRGNKSGTEMLNIEKSGSLVEEGNVNSQTKPQKRKMLARKVMGSASKFSKVNTVNKKGSIYSSKSVTAKKSTFDFEDPHEVINIAEDKSNAQAVDDETEAPEDEDEGDDDNYYVSIREKTQQDGIEAIAPSVDVPLENEVIAPSEAKAKEHDVYHSAEDHLMKSDKENSKSDDKIESDEPACTETIKTVGRTKKRASKIKKSNLSKESKVVSSEKNAQTEENNESTKKGKGGKSKKSASLTKSTSLEVEENEPVVNNEEDEPKTKENDEVAGKGKSPLSAKSKSKKKLASVTKSTSLEPEENIPVEGKNAVTDKDGEKLGSKTKERKGKIGKLKNPASLTNITTSLEPVADEKEINDEDDKKTESETEEINETTRKRKIPLTAASKSKKSSKSSVVNNVADENVSNDQTAQKESKSKKVEKENRPVKNDKGTKNVSSKSKKETSCRTVTKVSDEPACFLMSGHRLQRKEYQKVIKNLKGRVCRDSHQWSYQATHLIIPEPLRRTEKFFAAAASGRWILTTDYLSACNEARKLLPELPYEWHKSGLSEDGAINLEAPRKWRLVREKTGHGAFYGMRVIIYGECIAPPLETLKRAVKAGDGVILATSPPYTRFLESGVDFAIVSPGMPRVDIWVQEFLRHEIPCVLADYLVEYVCKPGYSLDKHVQYGTKSWAEKSLKKLRNSMEEIAEDLDESNSDVPCVVCGSGDRGEVMLICGNESGSIGCGVGTHIDCCVPPLNEVPEEDWFCLNCRKPEEKTKKGKTKSKRK